ncbi:hypothetical protein F442_00169 [Phytophthora nicotianae P10297]|uniref:carbonic anhydrase n=1 Tax=Phytophthora nicotianae P10297 TaxID=1317064 RepID=W3A7W8_PHYNI|nr:hypothetical protein F442_00169 [Phytophthora nicotianae P10297]
MASPEQWTEHYPTCGGSRQSPINIKTSTEADLPARALNSCRTFNLTQSDESFKGEDVFGDCSVSTNMATYDFTQFHFHSPSEHTLDGEKSDGSASLVVVGLFLQAGDFKTDPWMVPVLDGMDMVTPEEWQTVKLTPYADLINTKVDANRVYNYPGSLTTPACDEIVDWWVVPTPVQISSKDLERLQTNLKKLHLTDDGKNARPVQELNGRSVTSLK